jgi:hypothetical protein
LLLAFVRACGVKRRPWRVNNSAKWFNGAAVRVGVQYRR